MSGVLYGEVTLDAIGTHTLAVACIIAETRSI